MIATTVHFLHCFISFRTHITVNIYCFISELIEDEGFPA